MFYLFLILLISLIDLLIFSFVGEINIIMERKQVTPYHIDIRNKELFMPQDCIAYSQNIEGAHNPNINKRIVINLSIFIILLH